MQRRDFLSQSASAVGGVLGLGVLGGCATVGGVRVREGETNADSYLSALDDQLAQIRATPVATAFQDHLEREGLPRTFLQDNTASLTVAAAFRDAPTSIQETPEVQNRMWLELPPIGQQVLALAAYLDRLDERERKDIQAFLCEDGQRVVLLRDGMVDKASRCGLPTRRVLQFSKMIEGIGWRLQRQDPSLLIQGSLERMDRACSRVGVYRQDWSALATSLQGVEIDDSARLAREARAQVAERARSEAERELAEALLQLPEDEPQNATYTRAARVAIAGGVTMGVGAIFLGAGLAAWNTSDASDGAEYATTVGGVVVSTGLAIMVIAAAIDYVDKKRARCRRPRRP